MKCQVLGVMQVLITKVAFLTTIMLCLFSRQAVLVAADLFFWWPSLPGKQNPPQATVTAIIAESRNKCTFRTDLLITFPLHAPSPAHYLCFASVTQKPKSNQTILKPEQLKRFQSLPTTKEQDSSLAITLRLKPKLFHSAEPVHFSKYTHGTWSNPEIARY